MKIWHCWVTLFVLTAVCFFNLSIFSFFCYQPNVYPKEHSADVYNVEKKLLVILVMSAPKNYERRDVIRQTWMSVLKSSHHTQVYFVLGRKGLSTDLYNDLSNEQSRKNDLLLLEDLQDSYFRLTEKLVEALSVVSRRHNSTYLMKCDDDTFISSIRFINDLASLPTSRLYWGYFTGTARVKKTGPWAEPNFHLCDRYLPYARGGGYMMTWDIVEYILKNRAILQIYNSEDVTIGVWLAPLNIQRIHSKGFDTEATSRGCSNHHIVSHKQSMEDMRAKHRSLETSGMLCERETQHTGEYTYDWDVPPSQCCVPSVT